MSAPPHGLDHVRVAADHEIDLEVGGLLRDGPLPRVGLVVVLGAAVHVDDHDIGRGLRALDVRLHGALVIGNGIVVVGELVGRIAVLAVGVGEERDPDAVALDDARRLAVALGGVAADGRDVVVALEGLLLVEDGVGPDVVGVVGIGVDDVEAGVAERFGHGVGRVVGGVAGVFEVVARAEDGLLVHEGDVVALDGGPDVLVELLEVVVRALGAVAGPHKVQQVRVHDVVADRAERNRSLLRLCLLRALPGLLAGSD